MNGWVRSSFCSANSCVWVRHVGGIVQVAETPEDDGPWLVFTAEEWKTFTDGVKAGDFDQEHV